VPDIATASNSALPLAMESTPPPLPCARAHRAAAPPPQKPGLRPLEQRTRSRHYTTDCTTVRCGPAARSQHATCNARRCNAQRAPTQRETRAHATCNMRHALMPRCNTHRCDMLMQHTRRSIAPMQRAPMQCATRADEMRHARRCNMRIAHRTAHPVLHAPGRHRAATWLRHRYASMHASFRLESSPRGA
jgi:hypothetical protein